MTKKLFIRYAILALACVLLYFLLKKQNANEVIDSITQSDWRWFIPVFAITFLGNIIRALRWRMMVQSGGYALTLSNAFLALMCGYFINFLVPRLGELTRCVALKKNESVPVEYSLGTVVTERLIDVLSILLITFCAFAAYYSSLHLFFEKHLFPGIKYFFTSKLKLAVFASSMLLLCIIAYFLLSRKLARNKWWLKGVEFFARAKNGMLSIFRMKQRVFFLIATACIWVCYFLSTYLWFFGYAPFHSSGFKEALILLIAGTVARSFPVQGQGAGIYHFMIAQTVLLFGISEKDGLVLSILIYITQTAFYFFVGGICALIVLFQKEKLYSYNTNS
ncbi:MAG: flippase-like domain-containing protein [Cytophagaceae bacterium]|nr:flippase-like domain-containing protein [Cytophagaceae bacterium]MDW8455832.1 lysylphosphatidylglycerol synthase transmembrane domain-containing protein [Cytophagaceae bacterium]